MPSASSAWQSPDSRRSWDIEIRPQKIPSLVNPWCVRLSVSAGSLDDDSPSPTKPRRVWCFQDCLGHRSHPAQSGLCHVGPGHWFPVPGTSRNRASFGFQDGVGPFGEVCGRSRATVDAMSMPDYVGTDSASISASPRCLLLLPYKAPMASPGTCSEACASSWARVATRLSKSSQEPPLISRRAWSRLCSEGPCSPRSTGRMGQKMPQRSSATPAAPSPKSTTARRQPRRWNSPARLPRRMEEAFELYAAPGMVSPGQARTLQWPAWNAMASTPAWKDSRTSKRSQQPGRPAAGNLHLRHPEAPGGGETVDAAGARRRGCPHRGWQARSAGHRARAHPSD